MKIKINLTDGQSTVSDADYWAIGLRGELDLQVLKKDETVETVLTVAPGCWHSVQELEGSDL